MVWMLLDDWYTEILVVTSFLELLVTLAVGVVAVWLVRPRSPIAMVLVLLACMINAITLIFSPLIYFDYILTDPIYDMVSVVMDYWELFTPVIRATSFGLLGAGLLLAARARPPHEEVS